jgi:hypothetical protein
VISWQWVKAGADNPLSEALRPAYGVDLISLTPCRHGSMIQLQVNALDWNWFSSFSCWQDIKGQPSLLLDKGGGLMDNVLAFMAYLIIIIILMKR